jgi:predicted metalloprotease with PDZ domain
VTSATVGKRFADHAPGQSAEVAFFRKDRLHTTTVRLARNPERKWSFAVDPEARARVIALRRQWLGTKD